MALSEPLKEIYSSNPRELRAYETVELSHSLFSKIYYMVKDTDNHDWKLEDNSIVTFEAFGFDIKLPEAGSTQQDISFVFDSVGGEGITELEAAAELINEPIVLKYRTYIDGYDTPQTTVLTLVLTNIVADAFRISAIATRSDLYKRVIPSGNSAFFDARFHGLWV